MDKSCKCKCSTQRRKGLSKEDYDKWKKEADKREECHKLRKKKENAESDYFRKCN